MKVLEIVESARQSHGIRHSDYSRYRKYCSKKKSKLFLAERAYYYSVELYNKVQLLEESEADYRKHIHSNKRLQKASRLAEELAKEVDRMDPVGTLETRAYATLLKGRYRMQMHEYHEGLEMFKETKSIYEQLYKIPYSDQHKILIQKALEDLSPLIRYCNYNIDPSSINELLDLQDMDQLSGHIKHLDLKSRVFDWTTNFTAQGLLLEKLVKLENETIHGDYDKLLGSAWEATELVGKLLKDHKEATKSVESSISKQATLDLQRAHDYIVFWRVVWTIQRNLGLLDKEYNERQMIEDIKLASAIFKIEDQLDNMFDSLPHFKEGIDMFAQSLRKVSFANLYLVRRNYGVVLKFLESAITLLPLYTGDFEEILKDWSSSLMKRMERIKAQAVGFSILESHEAKEKNSATRGTFIFNNREFRNLVFPVIADRNMLPVPFRPIFYDLAYNFIEFPIENIERQVAGKDRIAKGPESKEGAPEPKSTGWFSFLQ